MAPRPLRTAPVIHVVAIVTAKPGSREEVLAAFREIVPTVRAERGCLEYEPLVDAVGAGEIGTPAGADAFIVVEKWSDLEALRAHSEAPHMADYAARVGHLIAARAVHVLVAAPEPHAPED